MAQSMMNTQSQGQLPVQPAKTGGLAAVAFVLGAAGLVLFAASIFPLLPAISATVWAALRFIVVLPTLGIAAVSFAAAALRRARRSPDFKGRLWAVLGAVTGSITLLADILLLVAGTFFGFGA